MARQVNSTSRPAERPAATSPARRTRPADRRERIVEAAAALFAEHGFESTSVRQIADRVDMLPGSLYHHFATKEDILHEILKAPIERNVQSQDALLRIEGNAEQRLIASVQHRFRNFIEHWDVNAILLNDGGFFRSRPEFAYVQAAKTRSFKLQEAILLDGMRARLFRPDMDVYMMIGTIARMLAGAGGWFRTSTVINSDHPDSYTYDRVVNFHVDCVLRLVRAAERLNEPIELD
ncbi:MAG: TetR/AcrR family transcriptional regulator [Sphingomonadales bacterium]|nr:TetR/AcrR family transcriptional regulator [Sphingomonadales bacterium]